MKDRRRPFNSTELEQEKENAAMGTPKKSVTKMNRRQFLRTGAVGCAALGLGALGFPAIVRAKTTLKMAYIPILDHFALLMSHARDNGSFKAIDIEPVQFKSWDALAGALRANVVGGAMILSNFAMDMFNNGLDIRTVAVGHRHGSGLTVSAGSSIASPADLKGKTVAVPYRVSTHAAILDAYLKSGGLSLKDVNVIAVAPPNMPDSLKAGSIDAFLGPEPAGERAVQAGSGRILKLTKDIVPQHICCIAVVHREQLSSNPEGIRELVRSMQRSGKFIDDDKTKGSKEVATLVRKYVEIDERVIVNVMQRPANRIIYSDLAPRLADFRMIHDLSVAAGLIRKTDLDTFVDESFARS
jgi:NitT/TauT family transport system substrate-binding protein